jgi:sporulation protein YlmC with PRC-barrel domain
MKRTYVFLLLAAVLLLLCAACSPAQPQPTEAVTSPAETEAAVEETEAEAPATEPAVTEPTEEAAAEEPTAAETAEVTEAAGGEATPVEGTGTPEAGTGGAGGEGAEGEGVADTADRLRLTSLTDYPVRFANSSVRGSIEDYVLDLNTEQVAYVLVNVNSPAAGGERVIPIPWSALTLEPEDNLFSLGFNLVVAPDAPTVDLEAGLDFTDPAWDEGIRAFWAAQTMPAGEGEAETEAPSTGGTDATGTPEAGAATATPGTEATGTPEAGAAGTATGTPEAGGATATPGASGVEATGTPEAGAVETEEPGAEAQGRRYALASTVFDAAVYFSGPAPAETEGGEGTPAAPAVTLGPALGRVEDLFVDPATGQLLFAAVTPNESLGLAEEVWVPIPVNLLSAGPRPGTLVVSFNVEALDLLNLPTIDPNQLQDFTQAGWLDQLRTFWESINP